MVTPTHKKIHPSRQLLSELITAQTTDWWTLCEFLAKTCAEDLTRVHKVYHWPIDSTLTTDRSALFDRIWLSVDTTFVLSRTVFFWLCNSIFKCVMQIKKKTQSWTVTFLLSLNTKPIGSFLKTYGVRAEWKWSMVLLLDLNKKQIAKRTIMMKTKVAD